ncbi:pentatricopeptide repeat-containing protein At5g42450, mitochondrial-like [Rhodamnia argentea]|uniref:Pentatricopeptide repeat-containing protein At5g42450, mitochondrial-like n=1 Tax=Rhodamnia argentea TaxID=178133 RepID=A0A8B8PJR9_9MYRT|nr:pentatricopeptide repeat-containing protein At5g42450, mitochondrial-like [Rhodamnia argentea]XP_048128226.1 pentatricopeptide repeat-containing protein At5g42450, mitochondrial-like [Rhodamnia argentea]XP_048128227.1 pentatricopeptide repeat-containing protein At5g42450, mitochondrial-like [Rhodamnia argentea]XP_048128228.1 pentatricopeptide repeat-containing protein At5g42450, mitochondrial-like [Rhodamnia argentea]
MKPIIGRAASALLSPAKLKQFDVTVRCNPCKRFIDPPEAYSTNATLRAGPEIDTSSHALELLDELSNWDVVSASALLGRYARSHCHDEVIRLFSRVLASYIRPNEFTFGTAIHSSIVLGDVRVGKQLHACAMKMGLHSIVFVGSAVLDAYAKLSTLDEARRAFEDTREPNVVSYTTMISGYLKKGSFDDALSLFENMPEKNVVSWNAVICGHSQAGHSEEAVNLFIRMLREGFMPNESSFPCALTASANIAALGIGRSFHGFAIKCLGKFNVFVANSLISFYARCGSMEESLLVFDKLAEKNPVSCNAVICGFAQNGDAKEAINFFETMRTMGFEPNSVSYLGLLWACNHAGLVDEGYSYFNKGRLENPTMLKPEHYACMVDLFSRCGRFEEAEEFLNDLPFDPGVGFWKALLGGCQIHSNLELGELAAKKILALDPKDVSSYIMISNAHSAAGRWQSVSILRKEMREKGLTRVPGCSWIEMKNKNNVFVTGDSNHIQKGDIYMVLRTFLKHVKETEASSLENEFLS